MALRYLLALRLLKNAGMKDLALPISSQCWNRTKNMKLKLITIVLTVLLGSCWAGSAQTNTPTAAPAAGDAAAATTNAPAPAEATSTNAPAPADAASTNAPAPAAESTAPAPEAGAASVLTATGAAQPGAIIPIIVMDDAKLTDAIRNLARMASLNYMLDPKIGFGQIGPDGKTLNPEPSVTIRWENVTAAQALDALLANYDLQIVEDPKSKIARVTKKDPAAPPPLSTKVYQLQYALPTNIVAALTNTFADPRRSKVVADTRTSQIVVVATENELAAVDVLIERLDKATKQVLIEARLLESSFNPSTFKGVDWSGTLTAQHFSYGNGAMSGQSTTTSPGTPTTTTLPGGRQVTTTPSKSTTTVLNSIIGAGGLGFSTAAGLTPAASFLNADGVNAVLSFINKEADAKVISAPRTVTLDNELARIEVVRAVPILNTTASTVNTTGGSQVTYTNLGVILNVTPHISANNFVAMRVVPEVSRVFDTVTKTVNNQTSQADEYDIRKLETRVMIPSGNTLVLGGLVQDDVRNSDTKVPILGDVPLLGHAFRSSSKTRQKTTLTIFITPTIVQDEDYQPTTTDFLKLPVPTSIEGDWTAWDSAKPWDWSKPVVEKQASQGQAAQYK
jgi:type II secretory pathway component GspD/PulD (secretin)